MIAIASHLDAPSPPPVVAGMEAADASSSKSGFVSLLQEAQGKTSGVSDLAGKDSQAPTTKKKNEESTSLPAVLSPAIENIVAPTLQAVPVPVAVLSPTEPTATPVVKDAAAAVNQATSEHSISSGPVSIDSSAPSFASATPQTPPNSPVVSLSDGVDGTAKTTPRPTSPEELVPKNSAPADLRGSEPVLVVTNDVEQPLPPAQVPVAPTVEAPKDARPDVSIPPVGTQAPTSVATAPVKVPDTKPQIAPKSNLSKEYRFASHDLEQAIQKTKEGNQPSVKAVAKTAGKKDAGGDSQPVVSACPSSAHDSSAPILQHQVQDAKPTPADKDLTQSRATQSHPSAQEPAASQTPGMSSDGSAPASGVLSITSTLTRAVVTNGGTNNQVTSEPAAERSEILSAPVATINMARLVEGLSQSEMHIGLRTLAFGTVEVHTVIHENQVGLSVGTERGDLKTLLASEVPTLRTALHHQDLHFEGIRYLSDSTGARSDLGSGGHSDARPFRQVWPQRAEIVSANEVPVTAALPDTNAARTGLSVHA